MKPSSNSNRFDFSRQDRVRKAIMREASDVLHRLLMQNPNFTDPIVSITDVEVSGDLQHAKIFLSIFGDDTLKQSIMDYIHEGYVQNWGNVSVYVSHQKFCFV